MNLWVLIVLLSLGLIAIYGLFFYLASVFGPGSPLRIRLSYLGTRIHSWVSRRASRPRSMPAQPSHYPHNPEPPRQNAPTRPAAPAGALKAPATKTPASPTPSLSDALPAMAAPTSQPLSLQTARQAMRARRRVWVKYLSADNEEVVDKLDIYKATVGGNLYAWFSMKRKRDALGYHRILAWQVLSETFERSPHLERWARWEPMLRMPKRLGSMLKRER